MIWIVGSRGMLGQEVATLIERKGLTYIGTDVELDFTSVRAVESFCDKNKPQWIINCAAYTTVDKAESEADKAALLNEVGPHNLAAAAKKVGARLIHLSTDYVFGDHGISRPLSEDDSVHPESVYGVTKLAGEKAIREITEEHFIIRISWLYGLHGKNFVSTMLSLMQNKPEIQVVDDQWGSPTWTADVASLFFHIITSDSSGFGTYHYSGEGYTTWYGFAMEIQRQAQELGLLDSTCTVHPCSSEEFPTDAKRPAWSVFLKGKIKDSLHIEIPTWQQSLEQFLEQVKESQ